MWLKKSEQGGVTDEEVGRVTKGLMVQDVKICGKDFDFYSA